MNLTITCFGIFALLVIIGAIIIFALRRVESQTSGDQDLAKKFWNRQQRAVWASATIVSVRDANLTQDAQGKEKINLTLQVHPSQGAPYLAHTAWRVELYAISLLVGGATVSIKIDAGDPKIIYPNMTGMEYWVWS